MILAAVFTAGAADSKSLPALYGNAAAKADDSLTLEEMLRYAAQDEYLARGEYEAIMKKFGVARPFSNIMRSEETHLDLLRAAFTTYGLSFPSDESAAYLHIPATLKEAFETGVKAEIDNIAMYDKFLATAIVRDPANTYLKNLFTNLRNASENHLRSFQNQLSKY
jgi:hypothetical protein